MSDNAIRVGDLCLVVRNTGGCACSGDLLGRVFTAIDIVSEHYFHCPRCRARNMSYDWGVQYSARKNGAYVPLSWLRKIPPLSELDDVERKLEEPA